MQCDAIASARTDSFFAYANDTSDRASFDQESVLANEISMPIERMIRLEVSMP